MAEILQNPEELITGTVHKIITTKVDSRSSLIIGPESFMVDSYRAISSVCPLSEPFYIVQSIGQKDTLHSNLIKTWKDLVHFIIVFSILRF